MKVIAIFLLASMTYPEGCYCQPGNCHPIPCSELVRMRGNAWVWNPKDWSDGGPRVFWDSSSKTLPSGDGQCHVCHWETGNSERGLCVFVPQGES